METEVPPESRDWLDDRHIQRATEAQRLQLSSKGT